MSLRSWSDRDMEVLRDVVRDVLSQSRGGGAGNPAGRVHQAPETYIAYPPSGGIPALTQSAGTAPDVAGGATCDIYQIVDAGSSPELIVVTNLDRAVYNLTGAVIPQDYLPITRDKFGRWIALRGGTVAIFGLMLAEDHPGRGTRFDVWVGEQSGDGWSYATGTDTEEAIDWRKNVDVPYIGATGLGFRRAGGLIEVIDLDCPPTSGTGT